MKWSIGLDSNQRAPFGLLAPNEVGEPDYPTDSEMVADTGVEPIALAYEASELPLL